MTRRELKKGHDREGLIVLIGLAIFFIIINVISLLLVLTIDTRREAMLRFEAEQALSTFFFQLQMDENNLSNVLGSTGVRGIAVYSGDGLRIFSIGEVPEVYLLTEDGERPESSDREEDAPTRDPNTILNRGAASYNPKNGMIEYTRRVFLTFTLGSEFPTPPEVLYIALDGTEYRRGFILMYSIYGAVVLLTGWILFYVWRLYRRNKDYRETLMRQASLVSLGEAARTLAHEIKNPLSAIAIQTAVMRRTLGDASAEGLEIIESEVRRLTTLTDRIGEFIRNPKGSPEPIRPALFVRDLIHRLGLQIEIVCDPEVEEATVLFDHERLRSVLENLIKNGQESTQSRTPQVMIRISRVIQSRQPFIRIDVIDDGDGLPEGQEGLVFDPFFTTKVMGSGIGLAISRQFVDGAGGVLTLAPREQGGTIATVMIPGGMR